MVAAAAKTLTMSTSPAASLTSATRYVGVNTAGFGDAHSGEVLKIRMLVSVYFLQAKKMPFQLKHEG